MTALRAARAAATDSPVFQLIDELPTPQIDRLKTDVFREQAAYSAEVKDAPRRGPRGRASACARSRGNSGRSRTSRPACSSTCCCPTARSRAWEEMVRLVEAMPEPLRRTVLVREQYGFALNRAERSDEAERVLLEVIEDHGPSSETLGLLGRVYKDRWEAEREGSALRARGVPRPGDRRLPARLRGRLARRLSGHQRGDADGDPRPGRRRAAGAAAGRPLRQPAADRRARRRLLGSRDAARARRWSAATATRRRPARRAALAAVREPWEPESTANNLSLIREARAARGETVEWADELERELLAAGGAEQPGRWTPSGAPRRSSAVARPTSPRLGARRRAAAAGAGRPDRADAGRGRAAGAATTAGSRTIASRWPRRCATTSSSATRAGCSAACAARGRTPRGCASSTRSARTRTWGCPRPGGSTGRCRSSARAAPLEESSSAETLGLAGAIYKRKWESTRSAPTSRAPPGATSAALSSRGTRARLRGHQRGLRLRSAGGAGGAQGPGVATRRRRCAREPTRSAPRSPRTGVRRRRWGDATLGEALFGLGRVRARRAEPLARIRGRPRRGSCGDWRRRRCSSARSPVCAASTRPAPRPRSGRWSATGRARSCAPPPARSASRCPAAASAPRCFTSGCSPGWRSARCCAGSRCSRASPAARSSAPTTTSSCAGCCSEGRRGDRGRRLRHARARARRRVPRGRPRDLRGQLFDERAPTTGGCSASRYSRTDRAAGPVRAHVLLRDPEGRIGRAGGRGG